jgi:hypothetical protein
MFKHLLVIAALASATPAVAQLPADNAPITREELYGRAKICLALKAGQVTSAQVVEGLKLDTHRKVRDFVLQCHMFNLGTELGVEVGKSTT